MQQHILQAQIKQAQIALAAKVKLLEQLDDPARLAYNKACGGTSCLPKVAWDDLTEDGKDVWRKKLLPDSILEDMLDYLKRCGRQNPSKFIEVFTVDYDFKDVIEACQRGIEQSKFYLDESGYVSANVLQDYCGGG